MLITDGKYKTHENCQAFFYIFLGNREGEAVREIVTQPPTHHYFLLPAGKMSFLFNQILGVGRQICLKKNLFCIFLRDIVTAEPDSVSCQAKCYPLSKRGVRKF